MDTVRIHDTIDPLTRPWATLADRVGAAPFVRPGWVSAWLRAFDSRQLRLYTVWRRQDLVGIAPLVSRHGALVSPTNAHTPLFGLLAEDAAARESLVGQLLAERPRHVDFGYLDPGCPTSAGFRRGLRERGYRSMTEVAVRSPFTDTSGDWSVYQQRLSKNRRTGLRRHERRLREQGELGLEIHDGTENLEALLAEGYRVEASGWKGTEGTAIQSSPETRQFYSAVARWAAEKRWLRLAFLRLNGRAIAFEFLLRHDDVIYDLKGGYDDAYRRWGPGVLLTYRLLEESFADPEVRSFEWLGEADPYKLEWSDGQRERLRLRSFAPSVAGTTDHLRHWLKAQAKRTADRWLSEASNDRLTKAWARARRRTA